MFHLHTRRPAVTNLIVRCGRIALRTTTSTQRPSSVAWSSTSSSSTSSPSPPTTTSVPPVRPRRWLSTTDKPGSLAFADCEFDAVADLFYQFAGTCDGVEGGGVNDEDGRSYLNVLGVRRLLESIGVRPDDETLNALFADADLTGDGKLFMNEFLLSADRVLGGAPARVILVVGGPGSGKGILCGRLERECNIYHLSSGDLLRDEVSRGTPIGRECAEIMNRGDLVPSDVITALVKRRIRSFPNRRILLDGFPRSRENAEDFLRLCGRPELALHLDCDDTVLMERIMKRGKEEGSDRTDDNVNTALYRLRTYHKYHHRTIEWLREQGVPIVNLDCSQTPDNVWNQLMAIGRLMRPAVAYRNQDMTADPENIDVDRSLFEPVPDARTG